MQLFHMKTLVKTSEVWTGIFDVINRDATSMMVKPENNFQQGVTRKGGSNEQFLFMLSW